MKLFFIVGMRRSGTSILRTIIASNPGVAGVEFEPHILWDAVDLAHFSRYKDRPEVKEIEKFRSKGAGSWYGAKFALNPGVKALEWVWLDRTFPGAYFIFIVRDREDTWKSYHKQDKNAVRGCIPKSIYDPFFDFIVSKFLAFNSSNPDRSTVIDYENLIKDPTVEMMKVWRLLDLPPHSGFTSMIRKPENWGRK